MTRPASNLITCCYCGRSNQPWGGVLYMGNDPRRLKPTPPICKHCLDESVMPKIAARQQDPTKYTGIIMDPKDRN